jgi:hypothetical protein
VLPGISRNLEGAVHIQEFETVHFKFTHHTLRLHTTEIARPTTYWPIEYLVVLGTCLLSLDVTMEC